MPSICSVPACQRQVMAKGWCSPHYYQLRPAPRCSVTGCEKNAKSKGLCDQHYLRQKRHGDPLAGGIARGETQRWIEEHRDHDADACLIWPFARSSTGYGVTTAKGRYALAHRVLCEARHGPSPSRNHEAAHSCGKGHEGCVNPRHLRWATKSENCFDAVAHGTSPGFSNRGEGHGMAKLTEADVLDIRHRRANGETAASLAKEFRVHSSCISRATHGPTWSHVA